MQAVRARHVAVDEGCHDQVSWRHGRHVSAGLLDHADELVADGSDGVRALAPVVPQVRPADAGQHDTDDRVSRLMNNRIRPFAEPDAPRSLENSSSHYYYSASRLMLQALSRWILIDPVPTEPLPSAMREGTLFGVLTEPPFALPEACSSR